MISEWRISRLVFHVVYISITGAYISVAMLHTLQTIEITKRLSYSTKWLHDSELSLSARAVEYGDHSPAER